jgi:GTP1/Obg family GTP-binding protein
MAAAEIGANQRLGQNQQWRRRRQEVASLSSTPSTIKDSTHNIDNNSSSVNSESSAKKNTPKKDPANTGRLRLLPQLPQPTEILSRASRHADREAGENFGASIANKRLRAHKRGALNIDLFVQGLCLPLKEVVKTYNDENASRRLHPFERVVLELALRSREKTGGKPVSTSLHEIHESRKELLQLSKDWIAKIKSTASAGEAYECTTEARKAISQTFLDMIVEPWSAVSELQKSLRNVPVVRLDCPAVVLVGAPNVGTWSLFSFFLWLIH